MRSRRPWAGPLRQQLREARSRLYGPISPPSCAGWTTEPRLTDAHISTAPAHGLPAAPWPAPRLASRLASRLGATALLGLALVLGGCGGKKGPESVAQQTMVTSIGVNSYLWRASLETMQFMPLAQVDSAGGVIVGDWYQNPSVPNERVKVTVAILDGALRADAVQVSAQREIMENGRWVAAPVRAGTVQRLEEIILERARTLRQAASSNR